MHEARPPDYMISGTHPYRWYGGQPPNKSPEPASRNGWPGFLHAAAIAMAALAVLSAVVTIAGSEPTRPRIQAFVFASLSVVAAVLGFRQFRLMRRVDASLALAADAWVLAYGGW